ncbi:MAG: RNA polymerase subunit sigma, partial [Paraclostridium sp.]
EISVALSAFNEAIKRYDNSKGPFLAYAKLVINSRLKTFFDKENKNNKKESLEKLREEGIDFSEELVNPIENKDSLINEMDTLKSYINNFGFSLDDLVEEGPKHNDTRKRAIYLGEKISWNEPIKEFMYTKKRLPIKQISLKYTVSEKIIKGSKKFIITVVVIFDKNLRNLKLWIRK